MGVIFHPCSSLCGSQQTLDHAGDQCVQCFIDGILYLALFNGIRNVNFWEILFSIAFICIIYDDWLGITALTPWTVLGAALLGSIGLSLIFKKRADTALPFLLSLTVTATTRMESTLVKI